MVRIMKNDVFNFSRFSRYMATDIRNAISNFGISLLVIATLGLSIDIFKGLMSMTISDGWKGLGDDSRFVLFCFAFFIAFVSSPSKIYGFFTDKKDGSAFLTLPVSTLEKTLSMVIISCILVPAVFLAVYLSIDQLVCLVDSTCGNPLVIKLADLKVNILDTAKIGIAPAAAFIQNPEALFSVWLYIDDLIQIPLCFLLGALYFNKSKVAKTFGTLLLLGMLFSLITTSIVGLGIKDQMEQLISTGELSVQNFGDYFPGLKWVVNHAVLVDTVNDTLINILLFFLVWLRIRKTNH